MYSLNLPPMKPRIVRRDGKDSIFDALRRRYVALTPEEWVRQHFVHFLIAHKGYPAGLLANEVELRAGAKRLRCDSVLYDTLLHPRMIMEYKAPTVAIGEGVFRQIAVYNMLLRVDYLVVSNGLSHYCCRVDYASGKCRFLADIPQYSDL